MDEQGKDRFGGSLSGIHFFLKAAKHSLHVSEMKELHILEILHDELLSEWAFWYIFP